MISEQPQRLFSMRRLERVGNIGTVINLPVLYRAISAGSSAQSRMISRLRIIPSNCVDDKGDADLLL